MCKLQGQSESETGDVRQFDCKKPWPQDLKTHHNLAVESDGNRYGEFDSLGDDSTTHGAVVQGTGALGTRADMAARHEDHLRLKQTMGSIKPLYLEMYSRPPVLGTKKLKVFP